MVAKKGGGDRVGHAIFEKGCFPLPHARKCPFGVAADSGASGEASAGRGKDGASADRGVEVRSLSRSSGFDGDEDGSRTERSGVTFESCLFETISC